MIRGPTRFIFAPFFLTLLYLDKELPPPYGANAFSVNLPTLSEVVGQFTCVKLHPWTHTAALFSSVRLAHIELSEILQRGGTALSPVCEGSV